jgi:hypothetical protein
MVSTIVERNFHTPESGKIYYFKDGYLWSYNSKTKKKTKTSKRIDQDPAYMYGLDRNGNVKRGKRAAQFSSTRQPRKRR